MILYYFTMRGMVFNSKRFPIEADYGNFRRLICHFLCNRIVVLLHNFLNKATTPVRSLAFRYTLCCHVEQGCEVKP